MKKFQWPMSWLKQKQLDIAFENKNSKLVFDKMLPGCIGFIAETGETVYYGEHYKSLKNDGMIA